MSGFKVPQQTQLIDFTDFKYRKTYSFLCRDLNSFSIIKEREPESKTDLVWF